MDSLIGILVRRTSGKRFSKASPGIEREGMVVFPRLLIPALLLWLVACSQPHPAAQVAAPSPTPSPVAARKAAVSPKPRLESSPSPTPADVPTVPATPHPDVSAAPVVLRAPNDPPMILSHVISSTHVHPGDIVSGEVITSSNVASLTLSIVGQTTNVPKISVGHFALSYRVPNLPAFVHGTFPLILTARNTAGQTTTQSIPITLE